MNGVYISNQDMKRYLQVGDIEKLDEVMQTIEDAKEGRAIVVPLVFLVDSSDPNFENVVDADIEAIGEGTNVTQSQVVQRQKAIDLLNRYRRRGSK